MSTLRDPRAASDPCNHALPRCALSDVPPQHEATQSGSARSATAHSWKAANTVIGLCPSVSSSLSRRDQQQLPRRFAAAAEWRAAGHTACVGTEPSQLRCARPHPAVPDWATQAGGHLPAEPSARCLRSPSCTTLLQVCCQAFKSSRHAPGETVWGSCPTSASLSAGSSRKGGPPCSPARAASARCPSCPRWRSCASGSVSLTVTSLTGRHRCAASSAPCCPCRR